MAQLKNGSITAENYVRALLEHNYACADLNPFINHYVEQALELARRADQRKIRGPLHGIPIAVKDNIDVLGMPTTAGCRRLINNVPRQDAPVVSRLKDAGALIVGKSNMDELAYGITGRNHDFGPARNPYARECIAGGSSAGSAVAVSAGTVPVGLGTDTGGSVRIPAALCGVVGMRPTMRRYSQQGVLLVSTTRDTIGPLARTVADVQIVDEVLTGTFHEGHHYQSEEEVERLSEIRLGVPRSPFYADLDPIVEKVVQTRLDELSDAGVCLIEADMPAQFTQLVAGTIPIAFFETPGLIRRYLELRGQTEMEELIASLNNPSIARIMHLLAGIGASAVKDQAYKDAMCNFRPALWRAYERYMVENNVSALIFPTTPLPARSLNDEESILLAGSVMPAFLAYTRNTGPGSAIGWPGLTIPGGFTDEGLPIGISLDGAPGSDRQLLTTGRALESVWAAHSCAAAV
ncbi:amidase family protein [Streptomyces sp. 1222.5]|uniref:amidase family protein n=1 Tax=Streptomyces sp. 1222.5 TaxID=1881026 RepID=UPI003EB85586